MKENHPIKGHSKRRLPKKCIMKKILELGGYGEGGGNPVELGKMYSKKELNQMLYCIAEEVKFKGFGLSSTVKGFVDNWLKDYEETLSCMILSEESLKEDWK